MGWWRLVGLFENKATQPSLAGAWAELGKKTKYNKNSGFGRTMSQNELRSWGK